MITLTSFYLLSSIPKSINQRLQIRCESLPGSAPPIVHEYCALHMFRARLERKAHELRRKRRVLGERVCAMSGADTTCLGRVITTPATSSTKNGNTNANPNAESVTEFWRFPHTVSPCLFVCSGIPSDGQEAAFRSFDSDSDIYGYGNAAKGKGYGRGVPLQPNAASANDGRVWRLVESRDDVRSITDALSALKTASPNVKKLAINLQHWLDDENAFTLPAVNSLELPPLPEIALPEPVKDSDADADADADADYDDDDDDDEEEERRRMRRMKRMEMSHQW